MKIWKVFLALSAVVATGHSAAGQQSATKSAVVVAEMGDFVIKNDRYSPSIDVVPTRATQRKTGRDTEAYALYGKVNRGTGATTFGVQWAEIYRAKSWRYYVKASNDKGVPLAFTKLSRTVVACGGGWCSYEEAFDIALSVEQIHEAEQTGIDLKIHGRDGDSRVVIIPAEIVKRCADKVSEVTRARAASGQ